MVRCCPLQKVASKWLLLLRNDVAAATAVLAERPLSFRNGFDKQNCFSALLDASMVAVAVSGRSAQNMSWEPVYRLVKRDSARTRNNLRRACAKRVESAAAARAWSATRWPAAPAGAAFRGIASSAPADASSFASPTRASSGDCSNRRASRSGSAPSTCGASVAAENGAEEAARGERQKRKKP